MDRQMGRGRRLEVGEKETQKIWGDDSMNKLQYGYLGGTRI